MYRLFHTVFRKWRSDHWVNVNLRSFQIAEACEGSTSNCESLFPLLGELAVTVVNALLRCSHATVVAQRDLFIS
jgi:hypothetical protein